MKGFRDIHSHFVYGVDDGAKTEEDMKAMLDAAHADGIVSLFATPHVTPGLQPFDSALFERRLQAARAYCRNQGYAMTLYGGAEILYTPALAQYTLSHRLPTLGESDAALVEFVPDIALSDMKEALELLERRGYDVVLAHVERYACLLRGSALSSIRQSFHVRCQMNCHAVLGGHGLWREHRIQAWLKEGLIDHIASDAHSASVRPFGMSRAFRALCARTGRSAAAAMTGRTDARTAEEPVRL